MLAPPLVTGLGKAVAVDRGGLHFLRDALLDRRGDGVSRHHNKSMVDGVRHRHKIGVGFLAENFVLAGASEPARELLKLLDLETLWAIYDTRQEAIEALGSSD